MNLYYYPEKSNCERVGLLEDGSLSYEFDILAVWQHLDTGKLYWARSSGCSCPSPFEDYHDLADLNNIHEGSIGAFISEVDSLSYGTLDEKAKLIRAVRERMDDFGFWVRETREKAGIVDET